MEFVFQVFNLRFDFARPVGVREILVRVFLSEFIELEILAAFEKFESRSRVGHIEFQMSDVFFEIRFYCFMLRDIRVDFIVLMHEELLELFDFRFEERKLSPLGIREIGMR